MNLTKRQLEAIIVKAYRLGVDDQANQDGYNIAASQRLIDPRKTKRPRRISKTALIERTIKESQ